MSTARGSSNAPVIAVCVGLVVAGLAVGGFFLARSTGRDKTPPTARGEAAADPKPTGGPKPAARGDEKERDRDYLAIALPAYENHAVLTMQEF